MKLILLYLALQTAAYDCFPTSVWIAMRQMGARVSYADVLSQAPGAEVGYYADPAFTEAWGFKSWMGYGTLATVEAEIDTEEDDAAVVGIYPQTRSRKPGVPETIRRKQRTVGGPRGMQRPT